MVRFLNSGACSSVSVLRHIARCGPIGVDVADDTVNLVQLTNNSSRDVTLVAAGSMNQPDDVKTGSGNWQRWVVDTIRQLTANGRFKGRDVVAVMPASEVFIGYLKMPKPKEGSDSDDQLQEAVFSKIKQKLPFEAGDAMIRSIPAEENNVVVIAAERKVIDRHLAIYENANLYIKSIAVWPMALINTYTKFFGRRQADIETVVMLIEIGANRTNVVICRHKNLLFAGSIPIGAAQLDDDDVTGRLGVELTACRRQFGAMYRKAQIERVIFLSSQAAGKDACATIAKQLEMPAQIGDCLAAVKIAEACGSGIDRRDCKINWTTAFGLSLS